MCETRCCAFTPSLPSISRQSLRQRRLECEQDPEINGRDDAGRAFEHAAKLRREIAELELDLSKGKLDIGEENVGVANASNPSPQTESEPANSPFSLAPTRWLISMDIGREKGTWMPQSWGISGRRLEVDLSVQFLPDGEMAVEVVSPFIDMTVGPGKWTVGPAEGSSRRRTNKSSGSLRVIADTCRFWVETNGFARGDVSIPPGKIYFAVPAWGCRLSRKGLVTVRQRRWIVREESRILGVFGTEIIETDANGQAQPGVPRPRLPPFASGYEDR